MKQTEDSLGGAERRRTRRGAGSSPVPSTTRLRARLRDIDRQMSRIAFTKYWYKLATKAVVAQHARLDQQRKEVRAKIKQYKQK